MDRIIIEKVFNAHKESVWKAWTDPELVKKWWGPKDFWSPSIKSDFRVGGKYIYAMHGPSGSQWDKDMYSAGVYKEIIPDEKIVATDYFSDVNGNKTSPMEHGLTSDMPDEMEVVVKFEDAGDGKTKLSIIYSPQTEPQYQGMKKSGMEEGWSTSLDKLASVLENT